MNEADRFGRTVQEICAELGIEPPRRVTVNPDPKRKASATALRIGRLGSGSITSTHAMVDDLSDEELKVVVRHEISHYRHAEARWAPLQALAGFSPLIVLIYGWPLAHTIGKPPTIALYFIAIVLHVLAFKSKRFFEARADHESVRNVGEALAAQRALLKFATLKDRSEAHESEGEHLIEKFRHFLAQPVNVSDRIFNAIWGVHPPLQARLELYDKYVANKSE